MRQAFLNFIFGDLRLDIRCVHLHLKIKAYGNNKQFALTNLQVVRVLR